MHDPFRLGIQCILENTNAFHMCPDIITIVNHGHVTRIPIFVKYLVEFHSTDCRVVLTKLNFTIVMCCFEYLFSTESLTNTSCSRSYKSGKISVNNITDLLVKNPERAPDSRVNVFLWFLKITK